MSKPPPCPCNFFSTQGTGINACRVDKQCSHQGTFRAVSAAEGVCDCFGVPATGFWDGVSCGGCAATHRGSTCRCGNSYCDGHGVCTVDGCVCQGSLATGYWAASALYADCAVCHKDWHGPDCKCPHATCNNHGVCKPGGCVCHASFPTGYWQLHNDSCLACQKEWTGAACNCRVTLDAQNRPEVCGGHGSCSATGCVCDQNPVTGWWGSNTAGMCDVCQGGHGPSCTCKDQLCGGHGSCTVNGCECNNNRPSGFWQVTDNTCLVCQTNWYGPGCRCATPDCDGHGTCNEFGCACHDNRVHHLPSKIGFFAGDGSMCTTCKAGHGVYPTCLCATQHCNGHGHCTTEGCICQAPDLDNNVGAWGAVDAHQDCSVCAPGFAGADCTCSASNCKQMPVTSDTTVDDSFSLHMHTVSNMTYNTTISLYAQQDTLVPIDTELDLLMKRVEKKAESHPRRTGPPEMVFLENAFRFVFQVTETAGNDTSAPAETTSPATYIFTLFLQVEMTYVLTPEKHQGVDETTAVLMVLSSSGWTPAAETCAKDVRKAEADTQSKAVRLRICQIANNAIYAVFAEKSVNDYTLYYILGGVGGALLIAFVVTGLAVHFRRKVAAERAKQEAKAQIIQFMQGRPPDQITLRQRLRLEDGEEFTPEIAASRLKVHLDKRRKLFSLLMKRKEFKQVQLLTKAMIGYELKGGSADNISALAALTDGEKQIKKIWEFSDAELHLLEACRLLRGMLLTDDGGTARLLEAALPDIQREAVETKAENVKLRRILSALQAREGQPSPPLCNPKQSTFPEDPKTPHATKVTTAPHGLLSNLMGGGSGAVLGRGRGVRSGPTGGGGGGGGGGERRLTVTQAAETMALSNSLGIGPSSGLGVAGGGGGGVLQGQPLRPVRSGEEGDKGKGGKGTDAKDN